MPWLNLIALAVILKQLTTSLFEALLMGRALSTEDLADLLSVKDNEANEQAHDFAHALELLSRDRSTPQARMALAARTVWRRVYMRDE
jgi:nuclear pore complex protein Nup133